jgi:CheY-like chemotaxis protein
LSDGWTALDHVAIRVGLTALQCRWCDSRFYRFIDLPEPVKKKISGESVFQLAVRLFAGRHQSAPKPLLLASPAADGVRYVTRTMPQSASKAPPNAKAQRPKSQDRAAFQPRTATGGLPPYAALFIQDPRAPLRNSAQGTVNRRMLSAANRQERNSKRLFCVLLLDDDPSVRRLFNRLLSKEGYMVEEASDISAAAELRVMLPDLMVVNLSSSRDEESAVKNFRKSHPELNIVVLSETGGPTNNMDKLFFVPRPCRVSTLIALVDDIAAQAPPPQPVILAATAYSA